jgi:glycosyltransferase involved in cell wall biosynthesis
MAEGFPNALCEAMLCGCIPVGSNVFSIPEIISDTGYILKHRNTSELKQLLISVVNSTEQKSPQACRKRIAENFPLESRKQKLKEVFSEFGLI